MKNKGQFVSFMLAMLAFSLVVSGVIYSQGQNFGGQVVIVGSGASSAQIQGAAASGSAAAGNPVLVAGSDAAGNVRNLPVANNGTAAPAQVVAVGGKTFGGNLVPLAVEPGGALSVGRSIGAVADATTNGAGIFLVDVVNNQVGPLLNFPLLFNGSTWDRTGYCPNYVTLTQAASSTLQIIALSGSTKIRICNFFVNSAAANTVTIEGGTGANCGTTVTQSTGPMNLGANGTITASAGAGNYVLITSAANEVCLVTGGGAGGTTGGLMWGQW